MMVTKYYKNQSTKHKYKYNHKYKHKHNHKNKPNRKFTFKIRRSKKTNTNHKVIGDCKGGAPFIKGGYGCIFRPALKCVGMKSTPDYVSKLIETKYAKREYEYVMQIKKKLSSLGSDVRKYFIR